MVGNLAGWYPIAVLPTRDGRLAAQLQALDAVSPTGGVFQAHAHCGVNSYLTMQRAICAILAGDPAGAWVAIEKSLAIAHSTWTWPEAVHPATNGGCMGDGSSGWGTADLIHMVRHVCYVEGPNDLLLWSGAHPDWWRGGRFAFQRAATRFGRVDCEVRVEGAAAEVTLAASWRRRPGRIRLAMPGGTVEIREGQVTMAVL